MNNLESLNRRSENTFSSPPALAAVKLKHVF
jgi:hypothetical protein